jgi:cardiolipin synthase
MSHSSYAAPEQSGSASGHVRLFFEGDALYDDMITAIERARDQILLETYIFADDAIGQRFADALVGAARRGVAVRVHVDAAGSLLGAGPALFAAMQRQGVSVRHFHKWSWRDPWRYNRRNHGKLLIIDGFLFYVGGFNLHEDASRRYAGPGRWRDTHARVTNHAAVGQAEAVFDALWYQQRQRGYGTPTRETAIRLVSNRFRGNRSAIRASLREAIAGAREAVRITTPYFSPDALTLRHLRAAAGRGVRVELLLPAVSDHQLPLLAARQIYHRLLRAGIVIYEYMPRILHAKTMTVDGRWSSVGTANLDYRSFFDNYETNLVMRSQSVCRQLDEQFQRDLAESVTIRKDRLRTDGLTQRMLGPLAWGLRRWL